jgi:methyl-accepting chemotaxis protein
MDVGSSKAIFSAVSRRLSMKFLLPIALILLIAQLAGAFFIGRHQGEKIEQDLIDRGEGLAQAIAAISPSFIVNYDMTSIEAIVNNLSKQQGVAWAAFYDAENKPLTSGQKATADSSILVFSEKILSNGQQVGAFAVGMSTASMQAALFKLYTMQTIATLSLIATMVVVVSWLFQKIVTRPLRKMTGVAQAVAVGSIQQQIDHRSQDEIGNLADSFRSLIEYIRETANSVDLLSKGNLAIQGNARSVHDILHANVKHAGLALADLLAETQGLITAAQAGDLKRRGDSTKFQGVFRDLVDGINATLNAVVAPIDEAAEILQRMARRDLTVRMQGDYRGDYLKIKTALNEAAEEMANAVGIIGQNSNALAGSSEELKAVSQQMSANAEETSSQTTVVSSAAEEVSKNVQTVATGAEEMGASIREIAKNATDAAKVAAQAVKVAENTNATVAKLGNSSAEIGNVVKVITSIAEQTNLLALNATIEAARAGEAGKGFAVVANEVKELAKETAKATEDISRKIEAIQGDTGSAVEAIAQISGIIKQINDISNTIASAVEQQSATTSEITRNITEAARGSTEIAQNVSGIMQAAQSTTAGATDTQNAAGELTRMAAELRNLVGQFKFANQEEGREKIAYWETLPVRVVENAKLPARAKTKSRQLLPAS